MNSTIVENNSAADGGGINDVAGTMVNYAGDTISGNRARGDGGGINATDSSVAFSGTTISGNHARGDGGGVNAVGGGRYGVLFANASFTDSTISGNSVGKRGGGLYNQGPVEAADTQIAGNRAGDLPSGGGGGIYDDGSQATAALTNSSPFCNKPNNCEPIGSIAGCTDLTPQACRPCLSQGGSGAAPSSLTGRPHPALRGSARRPPARRSVRRATPDSPGLPGRTRRWTGRSIGGGQNKYTPRTRGLPDYDPGE
jgi:predicted outer membrane repeat protein